MSNTLLLLCLLAQAESGPVVKPATEFTPLESFKRDAGEYTIRLEDTSSSKLKLDPKPVLHWSNPARTAEDGAVFVWLKDGRPEVIGSIFTYKLATIREKHEFHSLSTFPLTAMYGEKSAWKPRQPGMKFKPVQGAPVPAENARLRLIQIKSMARNFSAVLKTLEGETSELRLMPQPLYHYEPSPGGPVLEGALSALALGTDPEVLLMIEARREGDAWQWQYALARFNYCELTASFNGEVVWHVDPDPEQAGHTIGDKAHIGKIYSSFHVN